MKKTIKSVFNREVHIVDISRKDWFKTNSIRGWTIILDKVEDKIFQIVGENKKQKIDLIGHSSGGIILRLYLSNESFNQKIYNGKSITSNLITLGRPHQAKRATSLRKFVDEKYPGNFFNEVNYISVGGRVKLDSVETRMFTRVLAKNFYKSISGIKEEDGDGLVPLSSSILNGSQKIILQNTSHSGLFGENWYGTPSKTKEWFAQINWK